MQITYNSKINGNEYKRENIDKRGEMEDAKIPFETCFCLRNSINLGGVIDIPYDDSYCHKLIYHYFL